jgi:hypothetical protein
VENESNTAKLERYKEGLKNTQNWEDERFLFALSDILEKCFVVGRLHESKPWVQFAAEPYGKQFSGNDVHGLLFQETKTESGKCVNQHYCRLTVEQAFEHSPKQKK